MARIRWMFASWTNFAITLSTLNTHHKMKKSKPQLLNQSLILYLLHISLHMGRVVFRCPVNELPAFFDLFSCQSELAATVRISLVHTPQSTRENNTSIHAWLGAFFLSKIMEINGGFLLFLAGKLKDD